MKFSTKKHLLGICTFLTVFFVASEIRSQPQTIKEIMSEPSVAGMRAQSATISPDGKWVLYLWNAKGEPQTDLYVVSTESGATKKLLSPSELITKKAKTEKPKPLEYGVVTNDDFAKSRRNRIGNLRWAPDSKKFLFVQNGDIFLFTLNDSKTRRLTKTQSGEFSAQFLDNERVLFQQSGNIFALNTKDGTLIQLSREANRAKSISVFGASKSKNGSMIAYSATDGSNQRSIFVPNYLGYFTTAPTIRRGWTKASIYATKTDGSMDASTKISLPKYEGEAFISGLDWMADEKTLLVSRIDKTHKRLQIYAVTFADDKSTASLIFEEVDEKWIGGPTRILEPNPSNPNQFIFGSEKDGWHHIYLAKIDSTKFADGKANADISQLTKGKFEVDWARWSSPNDVVYSSTQNGTAERQVHQIDVSSNEVAQITNSPGMKGGFQLAKPIQAGTKFIYAGSTWRMPSEIFVASACGKKCPKSGSRKLTNTTPIEFLKISWNEPKTLQIPSSDGKMIAARAYFPANFDKAKKSKMVIFVHGAGYLQNVINGWNGYYREFMFNQLLTRKGFVVLDIDYRGSKGYGRDWRTDVYDFLGGKDYDDHIDAIDWMAKNYNIDDGKIGVYGGSYGGFMAAMLSMRAPEKIKASAALRPVMDWKNYYSTNPFYTSQRLRDPKSNPEAYKRSSPIAYAEKLESKLLILHGLIDDNVQAQDSIQLVEQLMRLDKTEFFDLMLYPSERHGFQRSTSWEDEYERIQSLFEKELD